MKAKVVEFSKNSIDPDLAETLRTVIGGAYGGLALQIALNNSLISVLLGVLLLIPAYGVFKMIGYAEHEGWNENDQLGPPNEDNSSIREVGRLQLRDK